MSARRRPLIIPARLPDIDARKWIRSVVDHFKAMGVSQEKFGEIIIGPPSPAGEQRRNTVTKWIRHTGTSHEPGFTYTRRIVTIAPEPLVRVFLGELASETTARVDQTAEDRPAMTRDAEYVAAQLDGIEDELLRRTAAARATDAINAVLRDAQRPPVPDAENNPGRVRRK